MPIFFCRTASAICAAVSPCHGAGFVQPASSGSRASAVPRTTARCPGLKPRSVPTKPAFAGSGATRLLLRPLRAAAPVFLTPSLPLLAQILLVDRLSTEKRQSPGSTSPRNLTRKPIVLYIEVGSTILSSNQSVAPRATRKRDNGENNEVPPAPPPEVRPGPAVLDPAGRRPRLRVEMASVPPDWGAGHMGRESQGYGGGREISPPRSGSPPPGANQPKR